MRSMLDNATKEMEDAVASTLECSQVCAETMTHCLKVGGDHAEASHINLLSDCSKICEVAANFMERESPFHLELCGISAMICDACAQSCQKLGGEEMERCAKACSHCAETCRSMIEMAK
jgi:hypothetical protein